MGSTVYGLGSPFLFFIVLFNSKRKGRLKTNEFAAAYGFLSTKMREEHYAWEVCISFRKLLLVVGTKLSTNKTVIPATLSNVFVTVAAFGMQISTLPFAELDANIAECLTLVSTLLVLILGLGQMASVDIDDPDAVEEMNSVISIFNSCMCVL